MLRRAWFFNGGSLSFTGLAMNMLIWLLTLVAVGLTRQSPMPGGALHVHAGTGTPWFVTYIGLLTSFC